MLKKHALSIAEGSASFVLAALGGSTYRTEYAFASSFAAAALDGLFDHPAGRSNAVPDLLECCVAPVPKGFFNNLLGYPRLGFPAAEVISKRKVKGLGEDYTKPGFSALVDSQ